MSDADVSPNDEPVGYGRPPRHSRFKPGKSGNPAGRPRGVGSLKSDLADELSQKVQVRENGRTMVLSKQRLAVKALVTKSINGHVPASRTLFELVRETQGFGNDASGNEASGRLDENDEAVIASLLARMDQRSSGD